MNLFKWNCFQKNCTDIYIFLYIYSISVLKKTCQQIIPKIYTQRVITDVFFDGGGKGVFAQAHLSHNGYASFWSPFP